LGLALRTGGRVTSAIVFRGQRTSLLLISRVIVKLGYKNHHENKMCETVSQASAALRINQTIAKFSLEGTIRSSLGANRTTNANMLSLSCEFLKPPQGRWFQRFG
jgi:hypothetical protein